MENNIPECPKCKKPTKRRQGLSVTTAMYFQPIYDENGVNINPDRNIATTYWECLECGETFTSKT